MGFASKAFEGWPTTSEFPVCCAQVSHAARPPTFPTIRDDFCLYGDAASTRPSTKRSADCQGSSLSAFSDDLERPLTCPDGGAADPARSLAAAVGLPHTRCRVGTPPDALGTSAATLVPPRTQTGAVGRARGWGGT